MNAPDARRGGLDPKRAPQKLRTSAVMLLLSSSLFSCSPTYVARAAWEEAKILLRRRPIADYLNDPSLDMTTRGKLELVVEVRSFARRDLNLEAGNSYTSFAEIDRDTLALVLSASPADRLAAYTWWFPIVGRVPYKGFFNLGAAEAEKKKLEGKGYDTYLRPTSAFSTLGWLPDPLLSTVLRQDSVGLTETVIHELTHNTLFVSGHVRFNESMANFVGSVGAIEFFCRRADESELCELARDRWHDTLLLGEFLDVLRSDLEALYARRLARDMLTPRRAELLGRAATRFRSDYAPAMRTSGFRRFDATKLNNASLIARHLYYHRLHLFQALYEHTGSLVRSMDELRGAVQDANDPWQALETLTPALPDAPQPSLGRQAE
ncbi:MAG: aminopeptidase [Gemmatimonadota bacterium]